MCMGPFRAKQPPVDKTVDHAANSMFGGRRIGGALGSIVGYDLGALVSDFLVEHPSLYPQDALLAQERALLDNAADAARQQQLEYGKVDGKTNGAANGKTNGTANGTRSPNGSGSKRRNSRQLPSQSLQLPSQSLQLPSQSLQLPSQSLQLATQVETAPPALPSTALVLRHGGKSTLVNAVYRRQRTSLLMNATGSSLPATFAVFGNIIGEIIGFYMEILIIRLMEHVSKYVTQTGL